MFLFIIEVCTDGLKMRPYFFFAPTNRLTIGKFLDNKILFVNGSIKLDPVYFGCLFCSNLVKGFSTTSFDTILMKSSTQMRLKPRNQIKKEKQ